MTCGGSNEPCAFVTLSTALSGGTVARAEDTRLDHYQALATFIDTELGIEARRAFVHFCPIEGHNLGWNLQLLDAAVDNNVGADAEQ